MSATLSNWYIGSDNVIQLADFYDAVAGSYLNSATVTATMTDLSGNEVTGVTWPMTLSYVAASNGKYLVTVDKAAVVTENATYFVTITAAEGGIDKQFRRRVIAVYDD